VKTAVVAIVAVVVALFAANMLGVAVAEAPTTTALRTVSVQGVATVPIGQADNAAQATAVYREAQSGAVADGQSKAGFLAGKVTASLAQVQSVVEDGGFIDCTAAGETEFADYEGAEPDFGNAPQPNVATPLSASSVAGQSSPVPHKAKLKPKKRKHTTARKAAAGTCKLTADVSLIYALG
jgi:hypothetical protein